MIYDHIYPVIMIIVCCSQYFVDHLINDHIYHIIVILRAGISMFKVDAEIHWFVLVFQKVLMDACYMLCLNCLCCISIMMQYPLLCVLTRIQPNEMWYHTTSLFFAISSTYIDFVTFHNLSITWCQPWFIGLFLNISW